MSRFWMKLVACVIVVILLLGLLMACSKSAPTASTIDLDKVVLTGIGPAIEVGGGQVAAAMIEAVGQVSPMTTRYEGHATSPVGYGQVHLGEAQVALYMSTNLDSIVTGVHEDLGKVPLRYVWNSYPIPLILVARGDSGIKTVADIKGKKVPDIPGTPFYREGVELALAYAGLSKDDVTWVTMQSPGAANSGLLERSLDVSLSSVPLGSAFMELAVSASGISYIELPVSNVEGWNRATDKLAVYYPCSITNLTGKEGSVVQGYGGARCWVSTSKHDEAIIYEFCRALDEAYPIYTQSMPETKGNSFEQAYSLSGLIDMVPFHDGAVKYFIEKGVWSPEHEKFQQEALKKQAQILGN